MELTDQEKVAVAQLNSVPGYLALIKLLEGHMESYHAALLTAKQPTDMVKATIMYQVFMHIFTVLKHQPEDIAAQLEQAIMEAQAVTTLLNPYVDPLYRRANLEVEES